MTAGINDEDWRQLTTRYPRVSLPREVFLAFLAERESAIHLDDLFLACAASRGDPGAIATVEAQHFDALRAAISRAQPRATDVEDLLQGIRARLFSARPGEVGAIGRFTGRGPLAAWLRIVGARHATSARRKRTESPTADGLDLLPDEGARADPELAYLSNAVRPVFHTALQAAVASLEVEDRNILRYYYVHDLSIDQIGAIYGLHRTSAFRRIRRARGLLVERTRSELKRTCAATTSELDSVLRAVESGIDVSIRALLSPSSDA